MEWSPRGGATAALAVLGGALASAALLVDPVGRVLVGTAAALLLLLAVRDVLLRPRLSAGPLGVVVRTLGGRRQLPWSLLRVRVRTARRFGVRSRTLELDTAASPDDPDDPGVLVLLGRRDLGSDPEEVARRLRELAASSGPGSS